MRTDKLWIKIVDMILESDDVSADWVKVTALRRCFHLSVMVSILVFSLFLAGQTTQLTDILQESVIGTKIYRCSMFLTSTGGVVTTVLTAYFYYRYILGNQVGIKLWNVAGFYISSVIFFWLSYYWLYLLSPNSFVYDSAPMAVTPTLMSVPSSVRRHFLCFSAFQSVNGSYYSIHANSALASLLTYLQTLFTIVLIALLVASYVNQKTSKPRT